jgi:hypothetical protein
VGITIGCKYAITRNKMWFLNRTAMPTPVVLLMQVCPGAHEMPLRQSTPVEMKVGIALALHSRARTQTRTANDFMACSSCTTSLVQALHSFTPQGRRGGDGGVCSIERGMGGGGTTGACTVNRQLFHQRVSQE